MFKLRKMLFHRSWYALRAIAYAHDKTFNPRMNKAQSVEYVVKLLSDRRTVTRALATLPDDAREALQVLLVCDGTMPARRFLARFGPLPPYRPWRADSPPAPWRHPASPAERLWFLGLIFFVSTPEGEVVLVPEELRAFLPGPPLAPAKRPVEPPPSTRDPIMDIAHLLAFLQGCDVRPISGRWLAPRHLRTLNVALSHPDPTVAAARSELQTGYLRFLHYLAQAANLIAPTMGLLKPTPAAWRWLDAPEAERWQTLWRGWHADLHHPPREPTLWARFRLPAEPPFVRTAFNFLANLPPGNDWILADLLHRLRARCIHDGTLPPKDDVLLLLQNLLAGPMTWSNLVHSSPLPSLLSFSSLGAWLLDRSSEPPEPPLTRPAAIHYAEPDLVITPPEPPCRPPLRPLVELALATETGPETEERLVRRLTRERFIAGMARGVDRARTIQLLGQIAGTPLSAPVLEILEHWEAQARALTLRRLTVLAVADPQLLHQLSAERAIHAHFQETLSARCVAVDPANVPRLLRALQRRGHIPLVEPGAAPPSAPSPRPDDGATAYLWLALHTYTHLADLVQLPAVPPAALLDRLGALLDADQLATLAAQADEIQRRLRDALDGYTPFPPPLPGVDHAAVQAAVERALEEDRAIEIVYHTAGRGERTTRTVEPLRLENRGGALYLVAYCRLRQSERVFRLDRIQSIVISV
jgi:hypothetical protein